MHLLWHLGFVLWGLHLTAHCTVGLAYGNWLMKVANIGLLSARAILQLLIQYYCLGPLLEDFQLTYVKHCAQLKVDLVDIEWFFCF